MPRVYLVFRIDAFAVTDHPFWDPSDPKRPSIHTVDITNTALSSLYNPATSPSIILKHDISDSFTYHTYTVACETIRVPGTTMSVIYSTLSATEAQQTIENIPAMVEESDKARQQAYGQDSVWDADVDQHEQFVKAEITWEEERCVRIKLNKRSTCWYFLETIKCEEPEEEDGSEVEDWG